jgi:hypothetical protein
MEKLEKAYGAAGPAFKAGDVMLTGLFAADPFISKGIQTALSAKIESLKTPERRKLEEMQPRRITPEMLAQSGAPGRATGLDELESAFGVSFYLGMMQPRKRRR